MVMVFDDIIRSAEQLEELRPAAKILAAHVSGKISVTTEEVKAALDDSYRSRLY